MEELTNRNKNEFLALCKQEFESFSAKHSPTSGKRYSLKEASAQAVISFKQEHSRYPKVFEFLQYVSRMFAIHAPLKTEKCAYYSYYRDEDNTQMGRIFKRIEKENVLKVLNFIAYDIEHCSTHTHRVKQVKSHFSQICVYPNKKYYKEFPDEIPEYVMPYTPCENSKTSIMGKTPS